MVSLTSNLAFSYYHKHSAIISPSPIQHLPTSMITVILDNPNTAGTQQYITEIHENFHPEKCDKPNMSIEAW